MSEGEQPKKYNTNPLDKRVAERAESQMSSGPLDTEAPTREMPPGLADRPVAGGPTEPMRPGPSSPIGADTASVHQHQPYPHTGNQQHYPGANTQGVYAPPQQQYQYPQQPQHGAYVPPGAPQHYREAPMQPQHYPHQSAQLGTRGSEALGLKPNFAAMLGYIPFVGIAAAFLFVLSEPVKNRFVRFHAKQALIAQIAFWVILMVFNFAVNFAPGIVSIFLQIPRLAFFLGAFIGFFVMMHKAWQGERFKLPVIGEQAE